MLAVLFIQNNMTLMYRSIISPEYAMTSKRDTTYLPVSEKKIPARDVR